MARPATGYSSLLRQWPAALQLATLGRQRWPTVRCSVFVFCFYFILLFYSTTSRAKERETEREREGEPLKPVQRSPLCWLAGM